MAPRQPGIQELRTQLEASRWQLYDGMQKIEQRLNVARCLRAELTTHPIKWAMLSIGIAVVAVRILPRFMPRQGASSSKRLLTSIVQTSGIAALPMIIEAVAKRFRHTPVHFPLSTDSGAAS